MPPDHDRGIRSPLHEIRLIRVHTHALLTHQIHQHGTRLIALVAELVLQVLVLLHVLDVLVEQVSGV